MVNKCQLISVNYNNDINILHNLCIDDRRLCKEFNEKNTKIKLYLQL